MSKKQTAILMHVEYKVSLPNHDFPIGKSHKLIPSVYASCLQKEDGTIGVNGPTYIAIMSGKHDKSSAVSHQEKFRVLIETNDFQESCMKDGKLKPLVFVSVDGGPDEAPKNTLTLDSWLSVFLDFDLDLLAVFTHAPGSSAYNPVERCIAPLSKDASGVILPFDTYGSHLNISNVTIDENLKRRNFKAAGEVLASIWLESVIDGHPVIAKFVNVPEKEREVSVPDEVTDQWKIVHIRQSQYMLQFARCREKSCCKFRTNFYTYFPQRFLPPPIPITNTTDGLSVSPEKRYFGSLFQAIYFQKFSTECFDQFCPSLQKRDKNGITTLKKRTCWKCRKYHSTIKAMNQYERYCDGAQESDSSDESDHDDDYGDDDDKENYVEVEFVGDDEVYETVYL